MGGYNAWISAVSWNGKQSSNGIHKKWLSFKNLEQVSSGIVGYIFIQIVGLICIYLHKNKAKFDAKMLDV